ncbi:hypothetical protein JHK85_030147 [Glycine max]|nr:hypothetical protein JHK87_029425 [Glycine soja]KAG4998708.1 hypothetical protein JHK85_030147 [Glycine max]
MKGSFLHDLANGISVASTYHVGKSSKRYLLPDSCGKYSKSITKSKQNRAPFHHKSGFLQRFREHAGLLFISTHKVAFCSDRSIKISSPNGEDVRVHYKVSIPLTKIKSVNKSQNVEKPSQKYIEIVTVDDFDFWFMGFFNYQKALRCLQQAVPQA